VKKKNTKSGHFVVGSVYFVAGIAGAKRLGRKEVNITKR